MIAGAFLATGAAGGSGGAFTGFAGASLAGFTGVALAVVFFAVFVAVFVATVSFFCFALMVLFSQWERCES